jgi:hypothetical protein
LLLHRFRVFQYKGVREENPKIEILCHESAVDGTQWKNKLGKSPLKLEQETQEMWIAVKMRIRTATESLGFGDDVPNPTPFRWSLWFQFQRKGNTAKICGSVDVADDWRIQHWFMIHKSSIKKRQCVFHSFLEEKEPDRTMKQLKQVLRKL